MAMEEAGRVVGVTGSRAEVEVAARGECAHCPAHGMCNWTGQKTKTVLAANEVRAQVGDLVIISLGRAAGIRSNLLVFGIPALGMLAGVLVGSLVIGRELWAGVLAGVGLALGFVVVMVIDRAAGRSGRVLPVVVRILGADAGPRLRETGPNGPEIRNQKP